MGIKEIVSESVFKEVRVPPGQHLVEELPVLDIGRDYLIEKEKYELEIDGLVENKLKLNYNDLLSLPQVKLKTDIHCVTTWSILDTIWQGVQNKEIVKISKPYPQAKFVIAYSYDGYTTNLKLEYFLKEDSIIALKYQGKDLEHRYGGPVRLLIPSLYFWKSAKWLKKIEFTDVDRKGYWEQRGYHNNGDPWKEERYG